jgi:hypothetical protein
VRHTCLETDLGKRRVRRGAGEVWERRKRQWRRQWRRQTWAKTCQERRGRGLGEAEEAVEEAVGEADLGKDVSGEARERSGRAGETHTRGASFGRLKVNGIAGTLTFHWVRLWVS